MINFHGKSITEFSEDLVKRAADTVEEFLDDVDDAVASLSSFDAEKSLVIVGQVVDDSRLDEMLLLDTNLVWVDVVSELADHLLDGAYFSIPVETKFLQDTLEVDDCDFVTCVGPQHLNLRATDDVSQREGGSALLHHLDNFLSEAVELMGEVHQLTCWQFWKSRNCGLHASLTQHGHS